MPKKLAVLVFVFGVGFLSAWLLRGRVFSAPVPDGGSGAELIRDSGVAQEAVPSPPPTGGPSRAARSAAGVFTRTELSTSRPTVAPEGPPTRQSYIALQKTVQDLERQLKYERQLRQESEGEEIPWPADLDPHFNGTALREAMTRGMAEAGFPQAQVTNVDCSEYPCLVFGSGFGDKEDFEKLEKTPTGEEYSGLKVAAQAFGWGMGNDKGTTQYFGYAVFPRSEEPELMQRIKKRVAWRCDQWRQTLTSE